MGFQRCPTCGNTSMYDRIWHCDNGHLFCDNCKPCPKCDDCGMTESGYIMADEDERNNALERYRNSGINISSTKSNESKKIESNSDIMDYIKLFLIFGAILFIIALLVSH